jgi:hypothetical protein
MVCIMWGYKEGHVGHYSNMIGGALMHLSCFSSSAEGASSTWLG